MHTLMPGRERVAAIMAPDSPERAEPLNVISASCMPYFFMFSIQGRGMPDAEWGHMHIIKLQVPAPAAHACPVTAVHA